MVEDLASRASRSSNTEALSYDRDGIGCDACGGDGWLHHLDEEGRSYSEPCACRKRKQTLIRLKNSGLERLIATCTMDAFKPDTQHARAMKTTAEKYLMAMHDGSEAWMFIGGAVGCGKTHICTAVCGELINAGRSVRYMEWLTEARRIKGYINDENADLILGKYIDADVLYIDDLFKTQHRQGDTPRPTEADVRVAFELINHRYNASKPTIITSEWYITELLEVDEGTFSRVYEKSKGFQLTINRSAEKNRRTVGAKSEQI